MTVTFSRSDLGVGRVSGSCHSPVMPWEYRVLKDPDGSFGAEGFFRDDGVRQFRSIIGLPTESAAREWVYDQQVRDGEAKGITDGTGR